MSYRDDIAARKAARTAAILAAGECQSVDQALVLLAHGQALDRVNALLSGAVRPLRPRTLDLQVYYVLLHHHERGLGPAARAYVEGLCTGHYGPELPSYARLSIPFDPWQYELCNCPTENHLFNDTCCRLAETYVFPERVYSDGHTAAEYREYWADAFRRLVAARVTHGLREWRSAIYFHVILDDAKMLYCVCPPGPTREAARVLLDYLHLSLAISLRDGLWGGPHARVYNHGGGVDLYRRARQLYGGWVQELRGAWFSGMTLVSDYVVPEAIARLPDAPDAYVSCERLGPRYHPPGLGTGAYNPNRGNIHLCRSDREDWPGDSVLYNFQTPRWVLGAVQDWGAHQGTWHMHCLPWSLTIAGGDDLNQVMAFTGTVQEAAASGDQGGPMTWPNWHNDQDATIFQHRHTLFSQMRGWHQEKFWENLWDGWPDCPWPGGRHWQRLLGYRDAPTVRPTGCYLADSLGPLVAVGGWLFAECRGVGVALRCVRGACHEVARADGVPGRLFACDVADEVLLLEVDDVARHGGAEGFRRRVLALPLTWDEREVRFTNLDGDALTFAWKEDADPTVNGVVPDYGMWRFDDPRVRSVAGSGVIEIAGLGGAPRCVLHGREPLHLRREEG